jgi:L,D-peptidoglycan transpeptidase YkuD (ErfK/YbiS/YcfS/YnhG family)
MFQSFDSYKITTIALRWTALLLLVGNSSSNATGANQKLDNSHQCLVVLAKEWKSTEGVLRCFGRAESEKAWKQQGVAMPVVLGRNGLGRGRGLLEIAFHGAPEKREGDDRTPAGIFQLLSAFGYAPAESAGWIRLVPYLPLSDRIEGIDDPTSRYYNRLVDRSSVRIVDWRTSEKMRREDVRYKWGIVVAHNPDAIPGAGSCIFLHVWKDASTLTAGCTAMAESNLVKMLKWLDSSERPILIQMPRDEYRSIREKYQLPPDNWKE